MAGIIDTNILLYAANSNADENLAASRFLHRAGSSAEQWFITEGIVYEFYRVATHPRVFDRPLMWQEAVAFLKPVLECPRFQVVSAGESHWGMLEKVLAELTHPSGNLFFDIRTVVLMREHGIREIYTTDTDFLQFPEIKVINPCRREA